MVTLFEKKLDLAEELRAADVSEAAARAALEAVEAAIQENTLEQARSDEGATSRPRHRDPLRAQLADYRRNELVKERTRLQKNLQDAVEHRTAVKAAWQVEGRAAMLPDVKRELEVIFAELDGVRDKCRAALARLEEKARKLELPSTGYEPHFFVDWFVSSAHQESALEFRRRLAHAEGLL
jgi:hypothetical protein